MANGDLNCYQNIMHMHLAIITTTRIKATKNRTCQNKGKYVLFTTYKSESQRLGMVLSTLFGEGRACLAGNNYGNFVVFQVSFKFLLFLPYFVKPSRPKVQARFFRILTTRFSEIRQQIRVTRELFNQTALKTVLLKKQINITRAVLEYCTG